MHCNAVTTAVRAYRPEDDHWAQAAAPGAAAPAIRHDGWTPFRQQVFLRSIAEGATVELACAGVGLSPQSAYAFRNRASGAAFALGWAAARLLGRERMADTLLTRALEGQIETVTRDDGSTVDRLKYDNRLALGLLTRLDRQAESPAGQAARLVAQEFEAFTDAIGRDDSPARAGLFLGTRALGEAEAELAPVIALARADRFARTGAGLPEEVDTADLDLARRADWTADQWQRAEAAACSPSLPSRSREGPGESLRRNKMRKTTRFRHHLNFLNFATTACRRSGTIRTMAWSPISRRRTIMTARKWVAGAPTITCAR